MGGLDTVATGTGSGTIVGCWTFGCWTFGCWTFGCWTFGCIWGYWVPSYGVSLRSLRLLRSWAGTISVLGGSTIGLVCVSTTGSSVFLMIMHMLISCTQSFIIFAFSTVKIHSSFSSFLIKLTEKVEFLPVTGAHLNPITLLLSSSYLVTLIFGGTRFTSSSVKNGISPGGISLR